MTHPNARQQEIDKTARQASVAGLMLSGVRDQKQIANLLNVNQSTISRDIKAIEAEWKRQTMIDLDEAKSIDLMRIDEAIRVVMPQVRKGNLQAVDRLVALVRRRADIYGYAAPTKIESTVNVRIMAEQIANELGLDAGDVIAEAERIVAGAAK